LSRISRGSLGSRNSRARAIAAGWTLAAALSASLAGCSKTEASGKTEASEAPPVYAEVAPFELVERSGKPVHREDLLGRPWVASFLFTRCTGPCPRVAGTLRALQARLRDKGDGGPRIVTISVDPTFDTPEVLKRYADDLGADSAGWWFLTGDETAVRKLIRESFLSPVERAPEGSAPPGEAVSHRTQLAAVDPKGRVRGFFAGESEEDLDRLVALLDLLAREPR